MSGPPIRFILGDKNKRVHTCSVCGLRDHWGLSWSWYGSLRDEEERREIIKACSERCKSAALVNA